MEGIASFSMASCWMTTWWYEITISFATQHVSYLLGVKSQAVWEKDQELYFSFSGLDMKKSHSKMNSPEGYGMWLLSPDLQSLIDLCFMSLIIFNSFNSSASSSIEFYYFYSLATFLFNYWVISDQYITENICIGLRDEINSWPPLNFPYSFACKDSIHSSSNVYVLVFFGQVKSQKLVTN